jgi:hypothetical protein
LDGECGANRVLINTCINLMGKLEVGRPFGRDRLDGRIILKRNLKEQCGTARIGTGGNLL